MANSPPTAHIHAIGTAVPPHDIHEPFIGWATSRLKDPRERALFTRMAARSGIRHRWSVLPPPPGGSSPVDPGGFYSGNHLPTTSRRMSLYAEAAPKLAQQAISALGDQVSLDRITHLVVASCTGFMAPGVDQILAERLGLDPGVERTLVGFMGCYAAVAALLAMLQFADGAAAALVSADPGPLAIDRFFATTLPDSADLIRWTVGDEGFEMHLSGQVPRRIGSALADPQVRSAILQGRAPTDYAWAVHAGGRTILDAVEHGLDLPPEALSGSRAVLASYGNMSSATLMFALASQARPSVPAESIALAFGPGLAAEGFSFRSLQ
jgi:alpha-pyrone synthase